MSLYDSDIWLNDLDTIVDSLPELDQLAGKTVLITGAAGLICSSVVDVMIRYNETHQQQIKILVAGRSENKIKSRFANFYQKPYLTFVQYDANSMCFDCSIPVDYIIHGASNASPDLILKEPVETMLSNIGGLKCLLDYARDNDVKRVLYISSSEVYGNKETEQPYKTEEYGYIDLLNPRNSYSVSKRAAETLCVSYAAEYGVNTVIVRPGHIYGPTASTTDKRVSSLWAYAAARGENIVMKSDGSQMRSYCYCLDCASAILKVLLKGDREHAYNISNPESVISIREMAEILASTNNVHIEYDVPDQTEKKEFNPMKNSSLDSSDLLALDWNGLFDANKGLDHSVRIIRKSRKDNI